MHEAMRACHEYFSPKANRTCRTCKHRKGCMDRGDYVGDAGCSDYEVMQSNDSLEARASTTNNGGSRA